MLVKMESPEKEGMLKIMECELSSMTGLVGSRRFMYSVILIAEVSAAISADSLNLELRATPGPPPERRKKPNFSPKSYRDETKVAETTVRASAKAWKETTIAVKLTELTSDIPNSAVSSYQSKTLNADGSKTSSATAATGLESFSASKDSTHDKVDSSAALSTTPREKRQSSSATATQTVVKTSNSPLDGRKDVVDSGEDSAVKYARAMAVERSSVAGLSQARAEKEKAAASAKPSGRRLQKSFSDLMGKGYDPAELAQTRIDTLEKATSETFQREVYTPADSEKKPERVVIETTIIEVKRKITLLETKMGAATSFYVTAKLKNSYGKTSAESLYVVNHAKYINSYLIPTEAPSLSASIIRQGVVSIGIQQRDYNGASIRLQRRIGPSVTCQDERGSRWETIVDATLDANDGEMRYLDNVASTSTIMYRVLSVGSNGVVSDQFSSQVLTPPQAVKPTRGTELNSYGKITELGTKVKIYASYFPANAVAVSMRKYELGTRDTLDAKRGIRRGFSYVGSTPDAQCVIIKNKQKAAGFVDEYVKPGGVYLYVPIAWTKKGKEVIGSSTEIEIPQDAGDDTRVLSTVSNLGISITDSNGRELSDKAVTFLTTAELTDFGFEVISDAIGESASVGLFGGDISANRAAFNDLVQFSIVRENCTTGERESFGTSAAGTFTDNASTRLTNNVSDLEPGTTYIYRLTSCVRSPETLFSQLVSAEVDSTTLSRYTQQVAKFRGPLQLRKSTLASTARQQEPSTPSGIENTNPIEAGRTRNEITIEASIPKITPAVTSFVATQGRRENKLQWMVQGEVSEIDHFMIFISMRGGRRLVASVHADPSSSTFSYSHKFKEPFTETFYYLVVPIDLNFSKLSSKVSNKIQVTRSSAKLSKAQMDKATVRT